MIYTLVIMIAGVIGAVITQYVNVNLKQGPVKASASVALIFALPFYFFPGLLDFLYIGVSAKVPVVIIGASFVAMSSVKVIPSWKWMSLGGLIFSIIFLNWSKFFLGFGGGLGTTACLSVIITMGIMRATKLHIHK